jgi:hypothetical protein
MLGLPKPDKADWSLAEREGLIPPDTQYADWLKGFKKTPSRRERLMAWTRRLEERLTRCRTCVRRPSRKRHDAPRLRSALEPERQRSRVRVPLYGR